MDSIAVEIAAELADHGARLTNLEGWQKAQNGHLVRTEQAVNDIAKRLDSKFDKLLFWMMTELAAMLLLALGVWLKR